MRDRFAKDSERFPADERRRLLTPVRARRRDPTSLRGVERGFATYGRAMERGSRKMGLDEPVVITTHPLVAAFADLSWAQSVTYYALDDWSVHPAYRRWWPAYREAYRRIRREGHKVAAVSGALLERLSPSGLRMVVPNGLEPLEWSEEHEPVDCYAEREQPLLLYVGTLDDRLDVQWLRETARAMPSAKISLVGPVVDSAHLTPLRREPNIEILAPMPRAWLAQLIRSADVGLIPHRRTALTEKMSPLKLYEYLAGGLPVAATDLTPIRGVDSRVLLVEEDGDFASVVQAALALGRADEHQRRAFVQANSWRSRHDALLELAFS
ncbi:MAG: glycosyltransferase [Solirubrobacteraceae bacterium]